MTSHDLVRRMPGEFAQLTPANGPDRTCGKAVQARTFTGMRPAQVKSLPSLILLRLIALLCMAGAIFLAWCAATGYRL